MTREEAQRLREEEMAAQAQGKDCFIIPQANLDRFLPDGVTVSIISVLISLILYHEEGCFGTFCFLTNFNIFLEEYFVYWDTENQEQPLSI